MKIITEKDITNIPESEQNLIKCLLIDLFEINIQLKNKIYIDWQDFHNEYSPERTDPCPDYYGYYSLVSENGQLIGEKLKIEDLDLILLTISELLDYENSCD